MDTHILKEKSELFVFPLIFIQIAKLLTEHDLTGPFQMLTVIFIAIVSYLFHIKNGAWMKML